MTACGLDLSGCNQKSGNQNRSWDCFSELVWKSRTKVVVRCVMHVMSFAYPVAALRELLDNSLFIVSIVYLLMLHPLKIFGKPPNVNRNCIHVKFKSTLKSENACYHSVQNLVSSSLLSKNTKIKIHRSTILPVVLRGC